MLISYISIVSYKYPYVNTFEEKKSATLSADYKPVLQACYKKIAKENFLPRKPDRKQEKSKREKMRFCLDFMRFFEN